MSRNVIPVLKNGMFDYKKCKKAVGIKVYSKFAIQQLYDKKTELDLIEGLEELKLVELGYKVKMHKIRHIGFGIDIPEQIKLLEDRYYEN
jgi:CMP-2-keto-3-deoxyoctulosonic acid synthetase